MSTYKQEMREPEPCQHPDERMRLKLRDMKIGEDKPMTVDPKTGEKIGKSIKLTIGGNH